MSMQTIFNKSKRKRIEQTVFVQVYEDDYGRVQYAQYSSRSSRTKFAPFPGRRKLLYGINVKPRVFA